MKYKWFFDESGVLTECEPKLDNDTKLEFAPETDEMFYRAKLSGALTFQNEFDAILAKNFGYTHIVVLKRYSDTENDYVEVWRGKFTLTDCTINYAIKTIEVTPATIDRYTDVIAALETDYNIVKLAPQMHPVNINIRPCLQVYCYNSPKISNYIGHNTWEADCSMTTGDEVELQHFVRIGNFFCCEFEWNYGLSIGQRGVYYARINQWGEWIRMHGYVRQGNDMVSDDSSLDVIAYDDGDETKFNVATWTHEAMFVVKFDKNQPGTTSTGITITDDRAKDVNGHWDAIGVRLIANTDLDSVSILGNTYQTYDFAADDFVGRNSNYNKIIEYSSGIDIVASVETQEEPTEWGLSLLDRYFVKPANTATKRHIEVGISNWNYISYWYYDKLIVGVGYCMDVVDDLLKKIQQIADCYDMRNTIAKLLQKAGWTGQYVISGVFGSQGYVGNNLLPIITPKSNVISSYYDTPAQNAPISLSKIFRMLKQAYKVYWYIDENNNLHLEHISYFQNGYSYTELPQTLVDLESDLHTRTRHSKAYGQNVVKFDKSGMAAVIAFGWMDKQTVPFDGYDIKALDSYVEQGAKEENTIAVFSTDVDFVLSSPNDVSKDGFFLFALPNVAPGVYSNTLKIEKINITDENGDNYDVTIQNGDAAFYKIHKTFWRYDMPCENLQINNVADTALTTGRFKTQSLEFSDLAMADVISNVDNCIKLIKTQQGFGAIAKLSINLNSLATTADLVFTLFGRKYYLKGAALNGPMTITLNGEQITITVSNNRFVYGYTEPINELKFAGTDVVSVDFADTDTLAELTSADDMFKNCAELIAVNFANKAFGAVTTANDMFKGCANLVDLICPATESWKPDIDFSDCPNLTLQSLNDLIVDFLYQYDSGVHTITPNGTMWNALTAEQQTDIMAKATAKGWQIGVPAQYALKGTSTASAVYATINGAPVEIEVVAGAFRYEYNLPITSISFENDSNVTAIDFTESDLLAGITSLNDAFKSCAALVSVDFTGCDLSNVATATDCFSGCVALTSIVADSGVWMPDIDLSDTAMVYADMLSTIGMLYTYSTGTHTITFNTTVWDSFSQAQQQTISDAADAKGWQTNAVMVMYVIRGTSTNVNGTETFNIQFINDGALTPSTAETITCAVDGNGNWEYQYVGKKIYSIASFASGNNTITSADFTDADDLESMIYMSGSGYSTAAFYNTSALKKVDFSGKTLENVQQASNLFVQSAIEEIIMPSATFENCTNFDQFANACGSLKKCDLSSAILGNCTTIYYAFWNCLQLTDLKLQSATFASVTNGARAFGGTKLSILDLSAAIFGNLTNAERMFGYNTSMIQILMPSATFTKVSDTTNAFYNLSALTTINVPSTSTALLPTTSAVVTLNFAQSPLNYQSMYNLANWAVDLTNYNAKTMTFKTSAWNALSSAEQATIQGILQSKNWNLATA
jgi:hypothetical protein